MALVCPHKWCVSHIQACIEEVAHAFTHPGVFSLNFSNLCSAFHHNHINISDQISKLNEHVMSLYCKSLTKLWSEAGILILKESTAEETKS